MHVYLEEFVLNELPFKDILMIYLMVNPNSSKNAQDILKRLKEVPKLLVVHLVIVIFVITNYLISLKLKKSFLLAVVNLN